MIKRFVTVLSFVFVMFAISCDYTEITTFIQLEGTAYHADAATAFPDFEAQVEVKSYGDFEYSDSTTNVTDYFQVGPDGTYSVTDHIGDLSSDTVDSVEVRMIGIVGLLIEEELLGYDPEVRDAFINVILRECSASFETRWYTVNLSDVTFVKSGKENNQRMVMEYTQDFVTDVSVEELASVRDCQLDVLNGLKNDTTTTPL